MTKGKDDVPLETHGAVEESIPLMVIPSEAWTQPHNVELYGWVATEVLGGFLSFRAHGKMKIFDFPDESSNFKEMYFKVSRATKTPPFFLDSEKKSRFHLYWRMGYRSPRPEANELSEEERNAASLLQMV
ncbi:hypothetical protein PIB30_014235 [Stylosanthes scabra]|uniref:Uncharacterized protein n=1 Tax=Stylosanthes scabra TaxID=79078 RepID=A0ABU6X440_9FABA|nr:hypothetical protein [Stylosanthes scabra]